MTEKILRVFPRCTNATPDDNMATTDYATPLDLKVADKVLVSCTFTWDQEKAIKLYKNYCHYYKNVEISGPAFGDMGGGIYSGVIFKKRLSFH